MNYTELISELIDELSYRVGVPNIYDKEHQRIMSEILTEWGKFDEKKIIFEFLTEDDEKRFSNPILNRKIKYTGKDGKESEGLVGNLLTSPKDSPGRIEAEKLLPAPGTPEREKINKEIGSQGGGGEQDSEGGGETPQEEPKQGQSLSKNTKSGKSYHDRVVSKEEETRKKLDGEKENNVKNSSFNTETLKPQKGKLSDVDDEFSDGDIKQKGLEIGYSEKDGFKPAPGNAGSMLGEIMSGEVFSHLDENPNLTEDELFEKIHEQIEDTELGKQNGSKKKTKTGLLDATYRKNIKAIARAGITKYKENQKGIDRLESEGKITKPVKVRNFYGHEKSISQQVRLIESINGPIYTKEGIEVPKEVIVDLIKKSGGGENPSDTSTITIDKDGRALVTFHSDKLSTSDIQANSTPNKESEKAKELVEKSNLTDIEKADIVNTIEDGQRKLEEKEQQLKSAANQPAKELSNSDLTRILKNAQNNTNSDGTPNKDKTSTRLGKIHGTRDTKKRILKYLPNEISYDDATEEQKLKAYFDYMGDDDKETEPTNDQVTFLYRVAAQQGYNISADLSKIRKESLQVQRDTHKKLNEKFIALPNGKQVPMGDYIEGQNLVEKLHLNVMDGEKNESGVGKYPGLFNLNMGGTLVEGDELKKCIDVDGTDDFIENFEVGTPGDGEEETKNTKTGAITGRNIFVFAVTKAGKRIKVAYKTQRSKQGQSGKLSTTYQWDNGIQDCFKS